VRPHRDKERLRVIAVITKPIDRFLHNQRSAETFEWPSGIPVSHKVRRVLVRGRSVVLRGKPPVVPVIVGLRLFVGVEFAVEVPLTDMAGRLAFLFQQSSDSNLVLAQVHFVT